MASFIKNIFGRNIQPSLKLLRKVDGREMVESMNPGIHVFPDFLSDKEEIDLLNEVSELKTIYAFEGGSQMVTVQGEKKQIKISALRVTGRPEVEEQKIAPWGYGDTFQINNVPTSLKQLIQKITNTEYFNGKITQSALRDITINYRSDGMFKLDPHIDPHDDGSTILHVGLGSDVVFTLTPDLDQLKELAKMYKKNNNSNPPIKYDMRLPMSIRTVQAAIDTRSWTSEDIDAMFKRKSLLSISGDARYEWKHGIRAGVVAGPPIDGVCDWWGDIESDVNKRDSERVSIVLGYK
jgi:hypothetical protein